MKRWYLCVVAALAFCIAQPARAVDTPEGQVEEVLQGLRQDLDKAQHIWEESIDDPVSDAELQRSYQALQDECRKLYKRKGGFATVRQKTLCEITQVPYEMYHNELLIKVNNLRKQLMEIDTSGTVANDYYRRPSKGNLDKLRNIFEQVNKYYVGSPYTWNRYYNKYLFSRSRLDHARTMWDKRLREYRAAPSTDGIARRRAEFAYRRLKDEMRINNLPFCGKVGALYLSGDLKEYLEKEKEWEQIDTARSQAGLAKEVVIFIHGLGEDRSAWRKFPELLATEDLFAKDMDRTFQVYVFRYDTVEDSKSVEGFRRELAGFIRDILKQEAVDHVNVIGHSLGGVVSLKYLVQYIDELTEHDPLPKDQQARAKKLLDGYLDGRYRRPIARFIGIAPSLSGSEVANFMSGLFKKDPPLYERSLAPFQSGIPIAGDLQVLENQIGSRVNINSFTRLNFERPLDSYTLLDSLSDEQRSQYGPMEMEKLHGMNVKTLSLIGKQPFVVPIASVPEEDGLVKCYSANLNNIFMADCDAKLDIGYKSADVRTITMGHSQLIEVEKRDHPSYAYVVSFLCDKLIAQKDPNASSVKHFICLLRVYPESLAIDEHPDFCFYKEEKVYFSQDERYVLPAMEIRPVKGKEGSSNIHIDKSTWNSFTGVFYVEGSQGDLDQPAWLSLELSASGYQTKTVQIPVSGGLVTYAVRLTVRPQISERASSS